MKANELRLNNYVKAFKTYWQIDNTDFSNLEKIETYEFIPLTEEILLKCGFVKVKNKDKEGLREYIGHTAQKARYAIFGTDIFITKVDKRGLLWRSIECDFMVLFYHKSIPIKYLHQLQNLYFTLTGQELEINL